MRGVLKGNKAKYKKGIPHPPRKKTKRDIEREVYRQAGALPQLKKVRNTPSNLERLLRAARIDDRIADNLTFKEQQQLEADLSGLAPGRTQGTMPERLTAAWLVKNGYKYAGMANNYNPNAGDWGFQVPILGGRFNQSGTGSVADIFLSPRTSKTRKGKMVRVQGQYWHSKAGTVQSDEVKKKAAIAAGYEVVDLWDYEALNPGVLDQRMREFTRT